MTRASERAVAFGALTILSGFGVLGGLTVVGGCTVLGGCQAPVSEPAVRTHQGTPILVAVSPQPEAKRAWQESAFVALVRAEDWQAAGKAFDAVDAHPQIPELRYLRARIADEVGEPALAVDLLNGLSDLLPIFQRDIEALAARAALQARLFPEAASYYAKQPGPSARLAEARARLGAGQVADAQRLLDELLNQKNLDRQLLPEVLEARAELAHRGTDTATLHRCLLKLAVDFPDSKAGRDVEGRLRDWAPSVRLTKQQRFTRAEAFGSAGDFEAFEREMQAYQQAPGTPVAPVLVQRATAWALYKSRHDYTRAASLFDGCAKLDASSRAQDLFFAAKALARAHKDDLALQRYRTLSAAFPTSGYADQARYLAARSFYIRGAWNEAVRAYDAYLDRAGKRSNDRALARYERAVALVALGKNERAPKEVAALIQQASEEREIWLLHHLLGVAHLANGELASAEAEFRGVIAEQPLSFPALASAARLRAMGITDVPTIDPGPEDPALPPLTPVLPEKVATLVSLGLLNDAEQALNDQAEPFAANYATRGGEALCRAYAEVGTARLRYKHAQVVVRERAVQRAIAPTTEWLWDCLYPRPYAAIVTQLETELELPAGLMFGVMRQESAFAPRVRSSAGAIGLMQLMPSTARRLAESAGLPFEPAMLHRPTYNLTLAAHYLERVLERFSGNVPLAAAAYNAGPAAVSRWLGHAGNLPLDLFVAHIIYDETRGYVQRVVGNWARYRYVTGGVAAVPQLDLSLPTVATVSEHDY